eukprot:g29222.t1
MVKKSMKERSYEAQVWRLLQKAGADERRQLLDGRGGPDGTGVHGVCSHKSCGHIRYDARVSCFPFRLVTRMSSDLGWVLARLELLQAVQRRFRAAVAREAQGSAGSGSQHHGCWHSGAGSEAVRQKRATLPGWVCFLDSLHVSDPRSRLFRPSKEIGLRFEAYVPTHFLLGRRLPTPLFPVTSTGLQQGRWAWEQLYRARRPTSERPERAPGGPTWQESWAELRDAYGSVWRAVGQSQKRLVSQLSALERSFAGRAQKRARCGRTKQVKDPSLQMAKILQRWSQRVIFFGSIGASLGSLAVRRRGSRLPSSLSRQAAAAAPSAASAASSAPTPAPVGAVRVREVGESSFRKVLLPGGSMCHSFSELETLVSAKFASKRGLDGQEACGAWAWQGF